MKSLKGLLVVVALLACLPVFAADVTISWRSKTDPAAGWNAYFNHLQTPDALSYVGSFVPATRSAIFHNVSLTGLYQFGISRVEYVDDNGVQRRVESDVIVITMLDGQVIDTPRDPRGINVAITP